MKKIIISIICLIGCMFSCNSYYAVQNTSDNICKVNDESILNNTYANNIYSEKKVEILVANSFKESTEDKEKSEKRLKKIADLNAELHNMEKDKNQVGIEDTSKKLIKLYNQETKYQESLLDEYSKLRDKTNLGKRNEELNQVNIMITKKNIKKLYTEEIECKEKLVVVYKKQGKDESALIKEIAEHKKSIEIAENVDSINTKPDNEGHKVKPTVNEKDKDKDDTAPSFTPELNPGTGDNFLDKLFSSVTNWTNDKGEGNLGKNLTETLKNFIMQPLFMIGNLIIFIAAIVLGLKYIWSGVEGKGLLKEELPNFVIAIMFFYLAQGIYDLVSGTLTGMILDKSSFDSIADGIFSTVGFIVNIGAIIGFIVIGIKYMIGSASEKADFKQSLIPAVVGIILIYCVNNVVQFIYNIGTSLL